MIGMLAKMFLVIATITPLSWAGDCHKSVTHHETPLVQAVAGDTYANVKLILDGIVNINEPSGFFSELPLTAITHYLNDVALFLLHEPNIHFESMLTLAIEKSNPYVVEAILEKAIGSTSELPNQLERAEAVAKAQKSLQAKEVVRLLRIASSRSQQRQAPS